LKFARADTLVCPYVINIGIYVKKHLDLPLKIGEGWLLNISIHPQVFKIKVWFKKLGFGVGGTEVLFQPLGLELEALKV